MNITGKILHMALWNLITSSGTTSAFKFSAALLILSISMSSAYSADASTQEKNRLKKLLYVHDFDNINYDMLADADTTFSYLFDLGSDNTLSLVYEVNAECSMCIAQYIDFLKAYSKYREADSNGKVPLYVIAKGSDIEMLKYYLEKNKDLFPAVDVKDMTSGIMLSEETDGYDALYIVAKGKILNRVVWNVE